MTGINGADKVFKSVGDVDLAQIYDLSDAHVVYDINRAANVIHMWMHGYYGIYSGDIIVLHHQKHGRRLIAFASINQHRFAAWKNNQYGITLSHVNEDDLWILSRKV